MPYGAQDRNRYYGGLVYSESLGHEYEPDHDHSHNHGRIHVDADDKDMGYNQVGYFSHRGMLTCIDFSQNIKAGLTSSVFTSTLSWVRNG